MGPSMDNREFFRVRASVRVLFCVDTAENSQALASDSDINNLNSQFIEASEKFADTKINEHLLPLYNLINMVNTKLDIVLLQLQSLSRAKLFDQQLVTTDLSISGFGFEQTINIPVGTSLLLAIYLSDEPGRPLYALGQVLRNGDKNIEGQSPGGIKFTEISEAAQERIIKFAFNYERRHKSPEHS